MNDLQLELTKLIGRKELTFGCQVINKHGDVCVIGNGSIAEDSPFDSYSEGAHYWFTISEILGHKPQLPDFHRWMNEKGIQWKQNRGEIRITINDIDIFIFHNSSKDLLDQEESVLKQIVELIKSNQ